MADLEGPGGFGGFGDLGGSGGVDGPEEPSIDQARTDAIERLKRHAVPGGGLSAAELADRVRRVYLAQTRIGIDQVLADLPTDPPWSLALGLPPAPGQAPVLRPPRHAATTRLRTVGVVLCGLALLAGAGAVAVARATSEDVADEEAPELPTPEVPVSTLPPLDLPDPPATTAATTVVPTTAVEPGLGFVEPDFVLQEVGEDIAPGRYLSIPEVTCYWERVKGFSGSLDDVIANGGSLSGNHVIVDVLAGDAGLRSQGCDFRAYVAPAAPATTFGDGDWLVGSDIAPGSYRLSDPLGDPSMCAWERASNFTYGYDGVIDYAYPAGARVSVTLGAGERFSSMTCGTWTRA